MWFWFVELSSEPNCLFPVMSKVNVTSPQAADEIRHKYIHMGRMDPSRKQI